MLEESALYIKIIKASYNEIFQITVKCQIEKSASRSMRMTGTRTGISLIIKSDDISATSFIAVNDRPCHMIVDRK